MKSTNKTNDNLKCLIIHPKFHRFSYWNYTDVCKIAGASYPSAPLGLLTMAAMLPKTWELVLVDENVEPLTNDHLEWADIICTGGMLSQQKKILEVIKTARLLGKPVVVGGPDPTAQPGVYDSADYVVCGEGEITIPLFLEDFKKGVAKGVYRTEELADMKKSVVPRYDLIDFKNYLNIGVQYSRGCPFTCEFCDIIEMYGRKPRLKTNEQILQELQYLYDLGYRGHVDFVDDNFIGNKPSVKQLLPEVERWSKARKYPFFFSTEASINLADDDQLLSMMRNVDFRYVFIGIETPDDNLLKEMGKKQNVRKPIADMVSKILKYGIVVNGGFIMGFDNETSSTKQNMIRLVEESNIPLAMVGLLYALPNTQLTRRLQKEGRISASPALPDGETGIDQFSSGLNFQTLRPKENILLDHADLMNTLYNNKRFFARVTRLGLGINPVLKHKPGLKKILQSIFIFLRLTRHLGFNKKTGLLYWGLLFKVLIKNIRGLETALNYAAMYIHFGKQSEYIVNLARKRVLTEPEILIKNMV